MFSWCLKELIEVCSLNVIENIIMKLLIFSFYLISRFFFITWQDILFHKAAEDLYWATNWINHRTAKCLIVFLMLFLRKRISKLIIHKCFDFCYFCIKLMQDKLFKLRYIEHGVDFHIFKLFKVKCSILMGRVHSRI